MWVIEVKRGFKGGSYSKKGDWLPLVLESAPDRQPWDSCTGAPGRYRSVFRALSVAVGFQFRDYLSDFRLRHIGTQRTFYVKRLLKLEIQRKVKRVQTQPLHPFDRS